MIEDKGVLVLVLPLVLALLLLFLPLPLAAAPYGVDKAVWLERAFLALESGRYPRVAAVSWWHENFDSSLLRIDSSRSSLQAYREAVAGSSAVSRARVVSGRLAVPERGFYHAAFPDLGGTEDMVDARRIHEFERLAGKPLAWIYFSNNWYDRIRFPVNEVALINNLGKLPFIRMMPRSGFEEGPDPVYDLQAIIDGDFDEALSRWARDAAATGIPLLVEFGTEMNGDWFPWSGWYNGAGETRGYGDPALADGPERFRDAYRHVVDICDAQGAHNITWFFHVDAEGSPRASWNRVENYYPGDEYVDWVGVSVYGPQEADEDYREFSDILDEIYPRLVELTDRPVAILEFAVTELGQRRRLPLVPVW
ncbi:glycoside hydrolase family 26 protein [Thiolapillus sp.]